MIDTAAIRERYRKTLAYDYGTGKVLRLLLEEIDRQRAELNQRDQFIADLLADNALGRPA